MMQEEWDDFSFFFSLGREKKFKIIRRDEDRRDKENKSHCCARGGACWSKEGEAFPISMPEARRHQLTHSLTHTHHQHDPPQPARGTIARLQEVPAPGGQGGSS